MTRQARPGGSLAPRCLIGLPVLLMLACGGGSLDALQPSHASSSSSDGGGTLPPIDTGTPDSTGVDSTGEPVDDDDPRLCPADCRLDLPVDWVYEGVPPSPDPRPEPPPPAPRDPRPLPDESFNPQGHRVPVMMRDPEDGSLIVGEQRYGNVTLHRLDRYGQLEWNIGLPLPCDVCELSHVARHPSGDLLLSATGLLIDRGFALIAARYDPIEHTTVWVTTIPLTDNPSVPVRSGDIAALSDDTIAQLFLQAELDFNPLQSVRLVAYGGDGAIVEVDELDLGTVLPTRHPMLARPTVDGELAVSLPAGTPSSSYGLIDRLAPPLWNTSSFLLVPVPLDDLLPDARGHTIELGHSFDETAVRLVLSDRPSMDSTPHWISTVAFDSITASQAALAVGPDGNPYAAIRTEQALGEDAEPLVGLSMARWTSEGELRWRLTRLDRLDPEYDPIELAVDETDGLIIATVADDRLRVERRLQRCACG